MGAINRKESKKHGAVFSGVVRGGGAIVRRGERVMVAGCESDSDGVGRGGAGNSGDRSVPERGVVCSVRREVRQELPERGRDEAEVRYIRAKPQVHPCPQQETFALHSLR